jgi:hypothetical protein
MEVRRKGQGRIYVVGSVAPSTLDNLGLLMEVAGWIPTSIKVPLGRILENQAFCLIRCARFDVSHLPSIYLLQLKQ